MARRRPKGEGSLYFNETRKSWVGQFNLPDGKTKTKYAKTQKEIKDWLLKMRGDYRDGFLIDQDRVTLSQFIDRYIEDVAKNSLRQKTLESYNSLIRVHIKPALGECRLSQLRPDQLQRLYAQKIESGLSNRTVRYIHTILHMVLEQALKWGLVTRNVADLVEPPAAVKRKPNIWTADQAKTFLAHTKDSRFSPMYKLGLYGLREGEILGIRIEDFDRVNHTLTINHNLQYLIGQGLTLSEPKTECGKRTLKLPDFVYEALVNHVDTINRNQGFMFTTGNGTPFSPRNFYRDFEKNTKESGLPKIKFHELRHTSISLMMSMGVPPAVVQSIVGHASPILTLSVYTHMNTDDQTNAAKKMDDLLG